MNVDKENYQRKNKIIQKKKNENLFFKKRKKRIRHIFKMSELINKGIKFENIDFSFDNTFIDKIFNMKDSLNVKIKKIK